MTAQADLPFARYPQGGRALLGRPLGGLPRRAYPDILSWCELRCSYCGLDLSTFEGWLQVSIDYVVSQESIGPSVPGDWVLDRANIVASCRSCSELFNWDPETPANPTSLEAFFDLRDSVFVRRRARIGERRAVERAWFEENVARRNASGA